MPIFTKPTEYSRFIALIEYCHFANTHASFSAFKKRQLEQRQEILQRFYRNNALQVDVLAFCLMTNHYHLILKQYIDQGISKFIGNIQNAYGKYFNMRNGRTGPLFQPSFQAVRIETDEQLLHVSRYIHLNPSTGFIVSIQNLLSYAWSSLSDYVNGKKDYQFINSKLVLDLIGKGESYKSFIFDQANYQRELGVIKHIMRE